MIAFVDMILAPSNWSLCLREMGFSWSRSLPQPIADQVKLFDFTWIHKDTEIPAWVRVYADGDQG